MGLSFKSIGRAIGKGAKSVAKGVTKAASFVPGSPTGLLGSAANAALNKKPILSSVVGDLARNSKLASQIAAVVPGGGQATSAIGNVANGLVSKIPGVSRLAGGGGGVPILARPGVRDILGSGAPSPQGVAGAPVPPPPGPSASSGIRDGITGAIRGALGGKPITIGNVTSAITGGTGGIGDVAKLLAGAGITAAGLKASHDASNRAHELQRMQVGVGNDLAGFGRRSIASADEFRDAAHGPLLLGISAGPKKATDFSRFRDTLNPYRARY